MEKTERIQNAECRIVEIKGRLRYAKLSATETIRGLTIYISQSQGEEKDALLEMLNRFNKAYARILDADNWIKNGKE